MKRRLNFSLINKPIRDKEILLSTSNNQNYRMEDEDLTEDVIFRRRSVGIVNDKRQLYQQKLLQSNRLNKKHTKSLSTEGDMLIID